MIQLYALILLVILGAIVVAGLSALLRRKPKDEEWPFYAKRPLSDPEQILYHRLIGALPDHIVLAQVQLSRFLGVKRGHNFQSWNNRINRMSVDFLLCRRDSSVVAAIELDDASHNRTGRREADRKKDRALAAAGIPIVRWNVKSMPSEAKILETFSLQR